MKFKEFIEILGLLSPTLEIVSSRDHTLSPGIGGVGIPYYWQTHEPFPEIIPKPNFYYPLSFNECLAHNPTYIHDRISKFHSQLSGYSGLIMVKNKLSGQYEPLNMPLSIRKHHELK